MPISHEDLRLLLCRVGNEIRSAVTKTTAVQTIEGLSQVEAETEADTIYTIDRYSEEAITGWLSSHWPMDEPVRLVMEGIPDDSPMCFPPGTSDLEIRWTLIIDPIDGTRGIMYDKRSAWALAGIAPHTTPGSRPTLVDIQICAMTELPTRKNAWADQLSCVRGRGVVATSTHIESGRIQQIPIRPSLATDFHHSFSSLVKFFPEGRAFTAQVEEAMWRALGCFGSTSSPVIFDDQYISTGGQFYEILVGHDRMIADLRPQIHEAIGLPSSLVCHPYDACCWPLLQEAGIVFCGLDGQFPDAPLDTTSPVSWIAFANKHLSAIGLPALQSAFQKCCKHPA